MVVATHPYIGGFTKYGQPIPRSDRPDGSELPTFSYGGDGIPRVLKQYRFSPHWYIFPNTVKQSTLSIRDAYAPLIWITTDTGNGWVSSQRQAIAWSNF